MTALPPNSLIIDVGGGIGSTSMKLAEGFPELKFVVQDREAVCALGVEAWKTRCPELLEAGRAVFQVHDFFASQPKMIDSTTGIAMGPPAAFILRVILHDWPDAFARRIP